MSFIAELWMPIVLSAVLVFAASSVIHMVIMWHKSDYRQFAGEDNVRAAIRAANASPGLYVIPYAKDMKEFGSEAMRKKFVEGPVGFVTLKAPGPPTMGAALAQWFVFSLGVATIAGYLAAHALHPGASFLAVCRVVGTVVFVAYGAGSVTQGIWMSKPWHSVAMELLDAAIYATLNAVAFAWLWPHG